MIIKQPCVLDLAYNNVSYKNDGTKDVPVFINWSTVNPLPAGVICKSSEATFEDFTFASNWKQLGDLNIPRGAYHFFRQAQDGNSGNVKFFVSTMKKYGLKKGDILVLDAEEQGMSASSLVNFLWYAWHELGNLPLLYSTASILNSLSFNKLSFSQRQFMKTVKIWTAGYPANPDLFVSVPSGYIPDQTKWGNVVLWQYASEVSSSQTLYKNIYGGLDINWIDPDFMKQWQNETAGAIPQPTPNPIPQPQPNPIPTPTSIEVPNEPQTNYVNKMGISYRVTATALNMRSGAGISNPVLKVLVQNATVSGVEALQDGTWIRVETLDGTLGWCSAAYLMEIPSSSHPTSAPTTTPNPVVQTIKDGVTFTKGTVDNTNYYLVKMDLNKVKFLVTPSKTRFPVTMTTSDFANKYHLTIAINGDGFNMVTGELAGTASSLGDNYYTSNNEQTIYISSSNQFSFTKPIGKLYNAISFPNLIMKNGIININPKNISIAARTSLGWNGGGYAYFLVVDGLDSMSGMTLRQLADFWKSVGGITNAVNLDGGKSSTIFVKNMGVINHPTEDNVMNKERAVANHIGIY